MMKNFKLLAFLFATYCFASLIGVKAQNVELKNKYPVPTEAQMFWQRLEMYAFIHFGLNTFNDLEWGYGNTDPKIFNPKNVDCDKWVRTLKDAGMKGVILTAKHHDGFCLWPTKTTEYSVKNSLWKNGKGDIVKELSDACHRHNLLFGLYLSPWDRNNEHYGTDKYREIFHNQIRELSSNYGKLFEYWFDGANGGNGWYGGADTIRQISPKTYYGYHDAVEILKKNNPDIMIFGGTEPTIRWVGNEHGTAGMTNWSYFSTEIDERAGVWGNSKGNKWLPAECDVSIRPGWFYHEREDHQVRTLSNLIDLYYRSVGRNATLLLNCPINKDGQIPSLDSLRLMQLKKYIDKTFSKDLFEDAVATSSNDGEKSFEVGNVLKKDFNLYYSTNDSAKHTSVFIKSKKNVKTNVIELKEYIPNGQKISKFSIKYKKGNNWENINTTDTMSTIGYKRLIRMDMVDAKEFRFDFYSIDGPICIERIAAYLSEDIPEGTTATRDEKNMVELKTATKNAKIYYKVEGKDKKYTIYKSPFLLMGNNKEIRTKVTSGNNDKDTAFNKHVFGISADNITCESQGNSDMTNILNTDAFKAVVFPKGVNTIVLKLKHPAVIRKIAYTPDQRRDASGHIIDYKLYINGKFYKDGTFDNIKNNPIRNEINISYKDVVKEIKIEVTRTTDDKNLSVGAIELF